MKLFKQAQKYGAHAALVASTALANAAHAAVPTEVTASLDGLKDDGITIATAVLVAVIAIFAFKFMRKGL